MSEFSASYHLKTNDRQTVIDLIQDSDNEGCVFPEKNGWVTFIVKGSAFHINKSLISLNPGVLVHYSYAEDHGWELRIYEKDELVFEYKCDWTDEIQIEKELFDVYLLRRLIMEQGNSAEGIEALFDLKGGFGFDEPPAYIIAKKLGLTYFEWVSADFLHRYEMDESVIVVG